MTIFAIAGRKGHTVINLRRTAPEARKLKAEMIAAGFKNVRISERRP